MTTARRARETDRIDGFRHDPRSARPAAALIALLLLLTAIAALVGPGFDPASNDPLWAALAIGFLAVLLAAFVWLMRRRPVLLRIGPQGIDMPLGFTRPLAWTDIHRIRRMPESRHLFQRRAWLVVDPSPGVLPSHRLPTLPRLERWLMPRWGLRIPLHALDAPPEAVIASIERFRPVNPAR